MSGYVYVKGQGRGMQSLREPESERGVFSSLWGGGVRKQDSSTLTAKAALLPSSYRTEKGSSPPGKGINQDLREPKPDKNQSVKIKIKHSKAKKR